MYEDNLFVPDSKLALKNLFDHIESGGYFRVISEGKNILSWGSASVARPQMHSRGKALIQQYYHTVTEGTQAVRLLRLFHQDMVEYATMRRIPVCVSNSIMDNYHVFNRILAKDGWVQRGATMYKRTILPDKPEPVKLMNKYSEKSH
jgi:hypothetical protein